MRCRPVWRDMAPDSAFLAALRKSERRPNLPHFLMFSYRGKTYTEKRASDGVVSVASQREVSALARAAKVFPVHANHAGILNDEAVLKWFNEILAGFR